MECQDFSVSGRFPYILYASSLSRDRDMGRRDWDSRGGYYDAPGQDMGSYGRPSAGYQGIPPGNIHKEDSICLSFWWFVPASKHNGDSFKMISFNLDSLPQLAMAQF